MNEKISWYIEKENAFLGENVIAICYHANNREVKECNLTNNDILIFIKNNNFKKNKKILNLKKLILESFKNEKIFLRIQSECLLGIYGDLHCDCEEQRNRYLKFIKENNGIYIHLPQEAQGYGLFYKLKELELQVNGYNQKGEYIGKKDRNSAFFEINKKEFVDIRKYYIIKNIFNSLGIINKKFIMLTDSLKKIKKISDLGINVEMYNDYIEKHITKENASEYLIKILDGNFKYKTNIIDELCNLIKNKKYNERTMKTFFLIIEKIKENKKEYLDNEIQEKFLNTYCNIISEK